MTFRFEMRLFSSSASRSRCLLALALVGLFGWLGPARAGAQDAQRVLLIAPTEAELTARILGQTRDLGVSLQVIDGNGPKDGPSAAELGRHYAAAIVVWTETHGAAGLDLHVLEVDTGELRTRRVSTPEKEALASSTTAEMAALVVRSELSALLSEIEAKRESKPSQSVNPVEPAAQAESPAPEPAGAAPTPAAAGFPWTVALAYRPSRPFRTTFAHGLALGLRRDLLGFALGATLLGTLPFRIENAGTELRLTRLQLRLEAQKPWEVRPSLRLILGLAAGLSVDFRSTEQVEAPKVRTTDAATLSASFGLIGQLEWLFSTRVGAVLGVGADGVPWRTKFVYRDGAKTGVVARLSWLDVWALVGFFTRFGA
jgi:hypothetical protein